MNMIPSNPDVNLRMRRFSNIVEDKRILLNPDVNLREIISNLLSYISNRSDGNFHDAQKCLELYKITKKVKYYHELVEIMSQSRSLNEKIFIATQFKNCNILSNEISECIMKILNFDINNSIKEILLAYYERICDTKILNFFISNVGNSPFNIRIIYNILSNSNTKITPDHFKFLVLCNQYPNFDFFCQTIYTAIQKFIHLIPIPTKKFISTCHPNIQPLLFEVFKKNDFKLSVDLLKKVSAISRCNLQNVCQNLNLCVPNVNELMQKLLKFANDKSVKLMSQILKRFGFAVDQNLKEGLIKMLLQIKNIQTIHFKFLFYIVDSLDLKNKQVGKAILQKYVFPGVNVKHEISDDDPIRLYYDSKKRKKLKLYDVPQISKLIVERIFKTFDPRDYFPQYDKVNLKGKKNIFIIEILKPFISHPNIKEVLCEIYKNHSIKCLRGSYHIMLKFCHIDLIYALVENDCILDHSNLLHALHIVFKCRTKNSMVIDPVPPIVTLNVVNLVWKIFDCNKVSILDMRNPPFNVIISILLASLKDLRISKVTVKLFYKFLKKYVKYLNNSFKCEMTSTFPDVVNPSYNRRIAGSFSELFNEINVGDGVFLYYLFEVICIVIRNIEPEVKQGVYILNKEIAGLCEKLITVFRSTNNNLLKSFILQTLIMINYYHLMYYNINLQDHQIPDDNDVNMSVEEKSEMAICAEIAYLYQKYNLVRLFSHRQDIKYTHLDNVVKTYPAMEPDSNMKNVIEDIQKSQKYANLKEDGMHCTFDLIASTLNFTITDTTNDFIDTLIVQNVNNISKFPTFVVIVASYVIMTNGNINLNENLILRYLTEGIKYLHSEREYEIVKQALETYFQARSSSKDTKLNPNQIQQLINIPKPDKFKKVTEYFLRMVFLTEARIYCVEKTSFSL